jgi:hypothetical protein
MSACILASIFGNILWMSGGILTSILADVGIFMDILRCFRAKLCQCKGILTNQKLTIQGRIVISNVSSISLTTLLLIVLYNVKGEAEGHIETDEFFVIISR